MPIFPLPPQFGYPPISTHQPALPRCTNGHQIWREGGKLKANTHFNTLRNVMPVNWIFPGGSWALEGKRHLPSTTSTQFPDTSSPPEGDLVWILNPFLILKLNLLHLHLMYKPLKRLMLYSFQKFWAVFWLLFLYVPNLGYPCVPIQFEDLLFLFSILWLVVGYYRV